MKRLFILLFFSFSTLALYAQSAFCKLESKSSGDREKLIYRIYYTLAGAYVGAGEVVFFNQLAQYNQKPVWHITSTGRTFSSYDWFYKVRDTYETFIDTTTMLPLKFIRNVNEGGKRIYNHVLFNHQEGHALSTNGITKISDCIQDVLSVIYNARNIDFNQYKPGQKIPVTLYLDDAQYPVYIRYLGKETITTKYGKYNTIKFSPLLIEGTLFKGGEKMEVWVTDDANKLPVLVNTPILVGSIKAYLTDFSNLRNPSAAILKHSNKR